MSHNNSISTQTNINDIPIAILAATVLLGILSVIMQSFICIIGSAILLMAGLWIAGYPGRYFTLVIFSYFITEQLYTQIFGGTLRIYFLVSIITIIILLKDLVTSFKNKILKWLVAFIAVLLMTTLLSYNIWGAFASSVFVILNMLPAFVVFLVLYTEALSIEEFQKVLYAVLLFSLVFGITQFALYRVTGLRLAFTEFGRAQLSDSQIPGLWTEANTYGKLVCWALVYSIPAIINNKGTKYIILALLSILTLIISPTRSASYAAIISIAYGAYWYIKKGKALKIFNIIIFSTFIIFVSLIIVQSGLISTNGYSMAKLQNFFITDKVDLQLDYSGRFRLESFESALRQWQHSIKTIIFGVGFGQAYDTLQYGTIETRVGGNDIMSILVGTGITGFLVFLISVINQHFSLKKMAINNGKSIIAEQMILLNIYCFCIMFFSGIIQTPEIWMVYGISAWLWSEGKAKADKSILKRSLINE